MHIHACKCVEYIYIYIYMVCGCVLVLRVKLIAFELAGEDRDRRENPVLSRLKIAFFALHKRG
jgi:hypothetical protein